MTIEFIRPDEIPRARRRSPRPELAAVRGLEVGEAIKFPCRWKHGSGRFPSRDCTGRIGIYQAAHRERSYGRSVFVRTACVDGTMYVERLAEPTDRRGREAARRLQLDEGRA